MLLQTVGRAGQLEDTGGMGALDEDLGKTIEGRNLECGAVLVLWVVGTQIGWIAIPCTDDAAVAVETEGEQRTGIGDGVSLRILYFDGDDGDVAPISLDSGAVGSEQQPYSWLGRLDCLCDDALAVLVTNGNHLARLVNGSPLQMTIAGHGLTA